jgi:hypothetical protein
MKLTIAQGLKPVTELTACIPARFYAKDDNPLLPVSATDDRGQFFMFDCVTTPPRIIEVIHTRADAVRGNHVHAGCQETAVVLSGSVSLYLLCTCEEKHLYTHQLDAGSAAVIPPRVAHAMYFSEQSEIATYFDNDPRSDRERVELISN